MAGQNVNLGTGEGYRVHGGTRKKMEAKMELKLEVETCIVVEGQCLAVGIPTTLSIIFLLNVHLYRV